ncbi:hypothetical protein [Streptomyces reniochalinae]|uniref:Uncharacterized protein n=1 Tax=Streptomyces reniochalinae TaxID=2250578 RepID=A0A367E677_9ACTN|nr:hypothetical protein [Streptomyces reniochalinae]RCG13259.1 hypothetical protein DQ392_33695 [Streptomyces reniochalinae]
MPLTYHDVMTTRLSALTDAAEEWRKMGDRFGTLRTDYNTEVKKRVGDGDWQGEGFLAAMTASGVIRHEFEAAKKEAHAIAKNLEKAHREFKGFRDAIDDLVAEVKKAGYKVNGHTGEVTYDTDALSGEEARALKNDPGAQTAIQHKEDGYTADIKKLVQKVEDADAGIKLALETNVKDLDGRGDAQGFNSNAEGNPEKVEAVRTEYLSRQLEKNGKLEPEQAAELRRLVRDNSHDVTYSRMLLDRLGTDGTVELINSVHMAARETDTGDKEHYVAFEKGLANTLGTATKDTKSEFYKKWHADMRKTGLKRFDDALQRVVGEEPNKPRGYQTLLTLMEQGNPDSYSCEMLKDLGKRPAGGRGPRQGRR